MHRQRVITAIPLALAALAIIWWGKAVSYALLVAVTGLCLKEYFAMAFPSARRIQSLGIGLGLLPLVLTIISTGPATLVAGLYLAVIGSICIFILSFKTWPNPLLSWATFLVGDIYIGMCATHFIFIRSLDAGREWIIFLLCVIFTGDIGAFYTGNAIGRHKLYPALSKGKTVEGAIGGLLGSIVMGTGLGYIFFKEINPLLIGSLAAVLGAIGQIGDLAESLMKRSSGFKDSGSILPGHGGIFDRIDALLLATPLMYWILYLTKNYAYFK
ncbi:MAG: phosphatidate cytidylyltransferase [Desulfobacteraceae bacterium]|nr:phosphatidate cytidylyltransferase [Desulfobacteraceae bacterium]